MRLAPSFLQRFLRLSLLIQAGTMLAASALAQDRIQRAPDAPQARAVQTDARPRFAEGELLVRWRDGGGPGRERARALAAAFALESLSFHERIGVHRYRLPPGAKVADMLSRLRSDPEVEFVEPNWIHYLDQIPNDPFYDNYNAVATDLQRWVYDGIGTDRNLKAEAAWDVTTGRSDVVLAIIDSGIDLDHPDLAANLWTNPGEIAGNSLDDDGNGFVDDVNGWDFHGDDGDPNPDLGNGIDDDSYGGPDSNVFHGTFSASCAGAVSDNGTGLAGAAWGCKLMALKIFTDDGGASTLDIAEAITYAADNGAEVANMSFGGGFSSTVQSAVNYAWSLGVVQVASAGNGNSSSAQYPASLLHVISVGASDSGSTWGGGSLDIDGRASFSQFGTAAVDVVAPGDDIVGAGVLSVADGNPGAPAYFLASGTSFSAPIVAGLCALVISRSRDLGAGLSPDGVEALIQDTAQDLPDDPSDVPNGGATWDNHGRVDFLAAVNAVTGAPLNHPPVANAGADQSGLVGQALAFDGSGSSDPDQDALTFSWNFGDGSPAASGAIVTHAYATAGTFTVTLTVSDGQGLDTDEALASVTGTSTAKVLFVSSGTQSYPGLPSVPDEDVVQYDVASGAYSLYFDGSDVGLGGAALDAFAVLPGGDLLISLTAPTSLAGLVGGPSGTNVDDSDLVRFTPSALGANTSGVFTFHFDGSDVGLTQNNEDIDGVDIDAAGKLLISLVGSGNVNGVSGVQDEDVLLFTASGLGAATSGTFSLHLDGSDVGLSTDSGEDVDAFTLGADGRLYLSTLGPFSVPGVSGADEDVLRFAPTSLGATTAGNYDLYLDGTAIGMPPGANITALHIAN